MNTFTESDLMLTFPDDWIVRKFDGTAAYRSVSGHGLKGVDFLCLAPDDALWLVEVKNYRSRSKLHKSTRRSPEGLAAHVGKKFHDTKRLIRVVNRAMRKKWWIELQLAYFRLVKRSRPKSTYWFWAEAERRLENPRNLVCLLWMETPERGLNYEDATADALAEWLEPGNELRLAEIDNPGGVPVRVGRVTAT
ncbi:hypothetical protein GGR28_000179 [Lewinella aquimaris]|uniref:Uncharacterized protein n=1 Tax=Neolewinella aquimaris TaxID=1835722 RepID=A0A840E640_9BACT|nr:hypothetical protein [Neolewinella aquimaris]MBB4077578.1 hypothetical protein [Neolewinella aquimaris]